MATIKSYTDIEQSKKLAEILPLESADMRYGYIAPYDYSDRMYDGGYDEIPYPKNFLIKNPNFSANEYEAELPCWSLAALLGVLPYNVSFNRAVYRFKLVKFPNRWECYHENFGCVSTEIFEADNPVDACYEIIIRLDELNLLGLWMKKH